MFGAGTAMAYPTLIAAGGGGEESTLAVDRVERKGPSVGSSEYAIGRLT